MNDQIGQELESDIAFQLLVGGAPDNAHAAAAKNRFEDVPAKSFCPGAKPRTVWPKLRSSTMA